MNEFLPVVITHLLFDDPSDLNNDPNLNTPPTVSISAPLANTSIGVGKPLVVQAQANDVDGSVASVSLSVDGLLVGTDATQPYRWDAQSSVLQNLGVGRHQLTAEAVDNLGASSSFSININVVEPDEVDRSSWSVSSSNPGSNANLAIDGNLDTRWTTGAVQQAGQEFIVNLGALETFDRAVLDITNSPGDYPRQYALDVSTDGVNWVNVANGAGTDGTETVIDFASQTASYIRITQLGNTSFNWWSIHELYLFTSPAAPVAPPPVQSGDCSVSAINQQWHRAELICDGPFASEANDATFTDYRFNVTFTQGSQSITVPGHFAADGNAAQSSATSGTKWRAYFSPPSTGDWNYFVSFKNGNNIAVDNTAAGSSVANVDAAVGSFSVSESTANSKDMRSRGLLEHRSGERYLRFAGDDSVYIQGGMDSPENIFGYSGFDNTIKQSGPTCQGILHDFAPHEADWQAGDPSWRGGRGAGLIGLINYIGSRSVNSIYIMMNTVTGDGCDAHPWTTYNSSGTVKSFDVSKLDQWEIALEHMTRNGIMIHAMTQETENDQLLNNGDLGLERKLYYRELISRFAHHPALQWNLGEENTNTTAQRRAYSSFIKSVDPYDHPIKMHTFPQSDSQYEGLLGDPNFDGATMQVNTISSDSSATGGGTYGLATQWIQNSADAGEPWVVTFTEASGVNAPTPFDSVNSLQRVFWMWASVMSGGGGFEWYLRNDGVGHAYDLSVEDLREFDQYWEQSGYLVEFFRETLQSEYGVDLSSLSQDNGATSSATDWVLSNPGIDYLIFLREGGSNTITLPSGNYQSLWFNPRTGASTSGPNLSGPGNRAIGNPPSDVTSDWALLVTSREAAAGQAEFSEQNGLVIMEAESTDSDLNLWVKETSVSGFTGGEYLEFTGNSPLNGPAVSPLSYTFSVSTSGLYHLHMRVARENVVINGETRTDVANDGFVRLDGDYGAGPNAGNSHGDDAPLANLKANTKFFGGNPNEFVWASGNRLDLGGETNKRVALYDLKAGETYTFVLHGRSQLFKVDRIVFRRSDVPASVAQDLGRSETR